MLSRNKSTIRSFLKKWNSQGVFRGQIGRPKKDDRAEEGIEATIRDRRSLIRQVGAALALNREQVHLTRHRNHFHFYESVPVAPISSLVKTQRLLLCHAELQREGWEATYCSGKNLRAMR
jgi:hypothetical protein